MEEAAPNVYDMEEVSSATRSLNEETASNLDALIITKISTARKGVGSNCMKHMVLLEQMDLRRLK